MKRIYSLLFAVIGLMAYTSCTNEVDDVFEKSSAERIQDAIEADKKVLTSAANGWLMEYYCGSQYGGYNVTCKFNEDNTVTVKNEIYDASESRTSHFKLEQSQGVILSFDEHNEFMHCFSDPVNPFGVGVNGTGMNGDFEFRVLTACADSVVMIGKKHGQKIKMTPIADGFDVEKYFNDVVQVEENMNFSKYAIVIGNDTIVASKSYRTFALTDPETGNDVAVSYIVTDKGFVFRNPIEFAGKTITGFDYREGDDGWLNPADNSVKLISIVPPIVEQFLDGDWFFSAASMSSKTRLYFEQARKGSESEGEEIAYMYYGLNSGGLWGFCFNSGGYAGILTFTSTIIDDNTVNLQVKGYDGNGQYYYQNCGYNYLPTVLNGTFALSTDDLKAPSYILFESKTDPDVSFVLYSEVIYYPFR